MCCAAIRRSTGSGVVTPLCRWQPVHVAIQHCCPAQHRNGHQNMPDFAAARATDACAAVTWHLKFPENHHQCLLLSERKTNTRTHHIKPIIIYPFAPTTMKYCQAAGPSS